MAIALQVAHADPDRLLDLQEVAQLLEQLREKSRADMQRTPNPDCPACQARRHRPEEWQHHPKAGTGFHGAQGKPTAEAQSQQQ